MKRYAIAFIVIAACAYGAFSVSAATQTISTIQSSLDRMTAVEAALK